MANVKAGIKGFVRVPVAERFWSKVDKRRENECWIWTSTTDQRGYGTFWLEGRRHKAHRVAWSLKTGEPFPKGKLACHTCDNPPCVNPNHIWPGSMSDNIKDARQKERSKTPPEMGLPGWQASKTECKRGHPLSGDNLYVSTLGTRRCRMCLAVSRKRYQEKIAKAALERTQDAEGDSCT